MTSPMLVRFAGCAAGQWRILRCSALRGTPGLADASHLAIHEGRDETAVEGARWELRGAVSHTRYVTRDEAAALRSAQPALGRPAATRAALIPIRKNDAWWALAQDERRAIFEDRSRHVRSTMRFLPAIARRLHHCRDLGEPFDFLTWFEFAPEHEALFDELVDMLRATEEWRYVDREVDVRLAKVEGRVFVGDGTGETRERFAEEHPGNESAARTYPPGVNTITAHSVGRARGAARFGGA